MIPAKKKVEKPGNMTTPEITAFVIFGLGLTAATAFQTLSRLHFPQLTTLHKEAAVESIMDVADDVLIEGIARKLEVIFEKKRSPLTRGARHPYRCNGKFGSWV